MNRKKILYIAARNIMDKGFIGRPHYFIKALSKDCDIFIYHKPQYWKSLSRESNNEYQDYFKDNVQIIDGYPLKVFGNAYLSEVLNIPINIYKVARIVRREKIDLVMSPDIALGLYSIFLPRRIPKVFLFDDFYPYLFGISDNIILSLLRRIAKILMDRSIRVSSLVVSCSQALADYAEKISHKSAMISNGVEKSFYDVGKDDKPDIVKSEVCFIGGIREYMDLAVPISAICKLKQMGHSVTFTIIGDGPSKGRFISLSKDLGVDDRVKFLGRVNKKDISYYIRSSDICIIPFKKSKLTDVTRPLKFFEYIACAKPVIMNEIDEMRNFFCGQLPRFVAFANNEDEFVREYLRMSELIKNKDFQDELAAYSRRVIDEYNWDVLSGMFVQRINKLLRDE